MDVAADAPCLGCLAEVRIRPGLLAQEDCRLDPDWRVATGPPLGPAALVKAASDL